MKTSEVRQKYLNFFEERKHKIIASGSLLPENDPTTLFTGSGMQVLIPYLLGEKHPEGNRITDSQKCFRAEDMEEVGDNRHTTFFEMLGNWSLGDYFKQEQLPFFFEFLVDVLKIDPHRLYVTVFYGDEKHNIPQDHESVGVWKKLFASKGIEAKDVELVTQERGGELGMQGGRIFYYDASKNWWSRVGLPENMPAGEPGGPDSEVFYEFTDIEHNPKYGKHCHPNCDCGRFIEIGNSVFMEYKKAQKNDFEPLTQRNVDFGGGLERLTAASNNNADIFFIDTLGVLIKTIESLCSYKYSESSEKIKWSFRVIADHVRAVTFLISDGALPSNKDRGYVVRRFLRRAVRHMDLLDMEAGTLYKFVTPIVKNYDDVYKELAVNHTAIEESIKEEEQKFRLTLVRGERELKKLVEAHLNTSSNITGKDLFDIYATYGFPLELSLEEIEKVILPSLQVDERKKFYEAEKIRIEFDKEFAIHQKISRAGIKKFHGGLADHSWECTKMHTATHLLHEALRRVLGQHVFQKGSNITRERLRFDFSHTEKMTAEQLEEVERKVNEAIKDDLSVSWKEMTFEEAERFGALGLFKSKYGEKVKVYSMGDYSKEVCGGPHVEHTNQVGQFKIVKEEAVSRGVRRIKAVVN